jgi:5'-nucleotidase
MKILLSNDDGVQAPGLAMLAKHLAEVAEITVVAPDRNRSGASNSLTLENPLRARRMENSFISVEGTPTDCVHLALTGFLDELPDMVVSGINAGANLGDDVWYSGTVAAAMEGRFLGFPAIAISLASHSSSMSKYYETAAYVAKHLVTKLQSDPLPANTILNVNVPDIPLSELDGYEVVRLGTRHCAEPTLTATDPRGHKIYWVGPPGAEQDAGPGTDFYAINSKRVAITPLQLDLTHYTAFEQLSSWLNNMAVE